jgi:hypothetical protein
VKLARYRKTIVAAITAVGTIVSVLLPGHAADIAAIVAPIVGVVTVYFTPNADA